MKAGNEDENKKAAAALVTHLEMVFFFPLLCHDTLSSNCDESSPVVKVTSNI